MVSMHWLAWWSAAALSAAFAVSTPKACAQSVQDIAAKAHEVQKAPERYVSPQEAQRWSTTQPELEQELARETLKPAQEHLQAQHGDAPGIQALRQSLTSQPDANAPSYELFVSLGMPAGELASAVDLARADPRVTLVLRGAPKGQNVQWVARALSAMGEQAGSTPNAQIDPPRFRALAITQVPVLIGHQTGQPDARVRGLFNPRWLEDQRAAGRSGDLGQHGPLYAITEEDMEERIKANLARMDIAAMRQKAMADVWARLPMIDLPPAERDSTRTLDPTITATQTLTAPDGRVIVEAGQQINPLHVAALTQRLVIFDARDPRQIQYAIEQGKAAPTGKVMYLFTHLPGTPSALAHEKLSEQLGAPAYLFVAAIRERFAVRAVPTVIDADADQFTIREAHLAPADKDPTHAHALAPQR